MCVREPSVSGKQRQSCINRPDNRDRPEWVWLLEVEEEPGGGGGDGGGTWGGGGG